MGAMVDVYVRNEAQARNQVHGKMAVEVRRRMEAAGKEMVAAANAGMDANFNLNRPFERRRHPGSQRAASALDYIIEGSANLPLELGFRVKGGEEVRLRIIGLNWGTPGHRIYGGSGTWPLKGQFNITRTSRNLGEGTNRRPDLLAWMDETGDVMTPEADHPGSRGAHFLEDALRRSVDRIKRG